MCVDCRVEPSGSTMVSGCDAMRLLRIGASSTRKWLVVPELLMAQVSFRVVVGCDCRLERAVLCVVCDFCCMVVVFLSLSL